MGYPTKLGFGRLRNKSSKKTSLSIKTDESVLSPNKTKTSEEKKGSSSTTKPSITSTITKNNNEPLKQKTPSKTQVRAPSKTPARTPSKTPSAPASTKSLSKQPASTISAKPAASTKSVKPLLSSTAETEQINSTFANSTSTSDPSTVSSDKKQYRRPCSSLDAGSQSQASGTAMNNLETVITIPSCKESHTNTSTLGTRSGSTRSTISSRSRRRRHRDLTLASDMLIVADAFHLDDNTRVLLANYDARSLEDFCLMTERDMYGLLSAARREGRPLPPLQVRKIEVLRDWVQDLADTQIEKIDTDESNSIIAKSDDDDDDDEMSLDVLSKSSLIPSNWKRRFRQDLPFLKEQLRLRGEDSPPTLTGFVWLDDFVLPIIHGHTNSLSNMLKCASS